MLINILLLCMYYNCFSNLKYNYNSVIMRSKGPGNSSCYKQVSLYSSIVIGLFRELLKKKFNFAWGSEKYVLFEVPFPLNFLVRIGANLHQDYVQREKIHRLGISFWVIFGGHRLQR